MQHKNPLFLKIDLTQSSPQVREYSSNKNTNKTHKHSPSPQLFTQPPQLQSKLPRQDRTQGHIPSKSSSSLLFQNNQELQKESSVNSRVTESSHSPVYRKGLILKTESSYQTLPVQQKTSNVKSFVKDNKNSYYYQIDPKKSRSVTPKSSQVSPARSNYKSEQKKDEGNLRIKIFIRVKPNDSPDRNEFKIINQKQIVISSIDDMQRNFEFHNILDCVSQSEIYNSTSKTMIDRVIFFDLIMIRQQAEREMTGSGKTFTMGLLQSIESPEQGLVSLGLHDIFNQLKILELEGHIQSHRIELSFIQIYLEEVTDLLNPESGKLQIREHKENQKPYVQGVIQVEIQNVEEGYQLIGAGIRHRVVASQQLNKNSSRSHTLLIFTIYQTFFDQGRKIETEGKVTFVDLAGSERIKKSNSKGIRIEEAKAINSSLSSLGNVIQALGNQNTQHIPFRDSKLTRILQAYMDGESSVSLICTVSKKQDNTSETLSTLMFAQRCKDVVLRPNLQQSTYNTNPSTIEPILTNEQTSHYIKQIRQLEDQIKQMSESSKSTQDYMTKVDEKQQSLVSYLIKIILKIKQYTKTISDQALEDLDKFKTKIYDLISDQGYQLSGSAQESKLISQYIDGIVQLQTVFKASVSFQDTDIEMLLQQSQSDITVTIQSISKSLLQDIHNIHQKMKNQASFLFKQLLIQLNGCSNDSQQWEKYVAYLITQGVIKERTNLSNFNQIQKELKQKEYINGLLIKAQDLFQIKDDLGECIHNKNKIKSRLNLKYETSFSSTINNLREFSNNIVQIPNNLNCLSTKVYMTDILQKERDKYPTPSYDQQAPQIFSSPQDQTNVSFLMINKKQQVNLFNDISSLENDRSLDNSKSNILELISLAQNTSKHLEMVDEADEFQSKSRNNLLNQHDNYGQQEQLNTQSKKKCEEKQNDSLNEKSMLSKNVALLQNQLQTVNNQVGKSTLQTLAGRVSSKQNSRDISRDGSQDVQIHNTSNVSKQDYVKILDEDLGLSQK